jgi:signal transduction histidine kinase
VLRPLAEVGLAAEAIAAGELDTRIEVGADVELASLADSFNDMAAALQARIERDARFASDVSHELRSPLTTLATSISVLESRRDELSERGQAALDLLVADVHRFQTLVEDLLEISRADAGNAGLHLEEIRLGELVLHAVSSNTDAGVEIDLDAELAHVTVLADKRRLVRVLGNLVENADTHGEGVRKVAVVRAPGAGRVQIHVDDAGAGVPLEERELIFERFARGRGAHNRGGAEGAGLGLALVREHVALHGGQVWVEESSEGGSRFVVELPVLEQ